MTDTTTIRREFAVTTLARTGGDERVIGGVCVPYDQPTLVSDGGAPYREMFVPGAFGGQVIEPGRVQLRYRHGDGLLDRIGRAISLTERPDCLWGEFRVFPGVPGDQALTLVDEGMLTGLSIEAVVKRSTQRGGVTVRERVHLEHVGLCEDPAYATAKVAVRRTRSDLDVPARPDPAQVARLVAVGIVIGSLPDPDATA